MSRIVATIKFREASICELLFIMLHPKSILKFNQGKFPYLFSLSKSNLINLPKLFQRKYVNQNPGEKLYEPELFAHIHINYISFSG